MKKILPVMVVSIALVAIVPLLAQGGGSFSNSSLSGTYVFQIRGNNSSVVQILGLAWTDNGALTLPPGCGCPDPTCFPCTRPNFTIISYTFPIPTPRSKMGSFIADGNGKITSGDGVCGGADLVENTTDNTTVPATSAITLVPKSGVIADIRGIYTVNADGTGTMSLNPVGCGDVEVETFSFRLAARGDVGVIGFDNPSLDGIQFPHGVSGVFMKK